LLGRDGHDWLVVTLLAPPLLAPALVAPLVVVEPVLVLALAVAVLRASAGSWPVTSTTAISAQAAMNNVTAPAAIRRRIILIRAVRAWRIC
jgi:hypothetical protein